MKKQLFTLAATSLFAATANAQITWSQSLDTTTIVAGSASCLNNPAGITDNSYWRNYDPAAPGAGSMPVAGAYEVLSVTFGVENATSTGGMQTITVNLRDGTGFPNTAPTAPILGTTQVVVMDTDVTAQTYEVATFTPPVFVPAGTNLAIEVMAPNGQVVPGGTGNFFFIGSNTGGEDPNMSSFLSAVDCGITVPVWTGAVGFDVDFRIDAEVRDAGPTNIGTNYCSPNIPNSTGLSGTLTATGSTAAAAQNVLLTAGSLPPMQFGYFVASRTQGFIAMPGNSSGNLCVVGQQGRYNMPSQIGNTGAGNSFSLQVGNINVPTNVGPTGETIMAGDSWNWQAWYRDIGNTNNFTEGLNIVFN